MKKRSKCQCQLNSFFQYSGGLAYFSLTHGVSFAGEESQTHYEPPEEGDG